jgi:hypothetical protein
MSRNELIAWMEAHLGLSLVDHPTNKRELVAKSTLNGAPLFTVSIYENEDGNWCFGGTGHHLTHFWSKFVEAGNKR